MEKVLLPDCLGGGGITSIPNPSITDPIVKAKHPGPGDNPTEQPMTDNNEKVHYANPLHTKFHLSAINPPKWLKTDDLSKKKGPHASVYMMNGDQYIGEWENNMKHGKGKYIYYKTGHVYEGEWKNDMREGFGTLSVPVKPIHRTLPTPPTPSLSSKAVSGSVGAHPLVIPAPVLRRPNRSLQDHVPLRRLYVGSWKGNRRQGFGTYYYEDQSYYEGEWRNNMRYGWGSMYYPDGSVYNGEWYEGNRHGEGTLLMPNKDRYEGMWLFDQKEGPGRFIYKQKRQAYEGEWSQGLPKCGTLVDLPPLPGHPPKNYILPELTLSEPVTLLNLEKDLITEQRLQFLIQQQEAQQQPFHKQHEQRAFLRRSSTQDASFDMLY